MYDDYSNAFAGQQQYIQPQAYYLADGTRVMPVMSTPVAQPVASGQPGGPPPAGSGGSMSMMGGQGGMGSVLSGLMSNLGKAGAGYEQGAAMKAQGGVVQSPQAFQPVLAQMPMAPPTFDSPMVIRG